MIRTLGIAVLSLFTLLAGQNVFAAPKNWQIDPAHSAVYFTVDHIYSKVRGHFNEFSGTVLFDPSRLSESSMRFVIKTGSIDTNIAKRDKHLQSADFFDAPTFPEMVFVSDTITEGGDNLYNVSGKLMVKGKSYDLLLPLNLAGMKEHPAQKGTEVAGFNGTLVIDRLAFGIGNGKFAEMGLVGKEVEILLTLEVLREM